MDSITNDRQLLTHGDPDGKLWLPAECDVPIRNHEWFWQPDDEHKLYSLDDLMNMYYRSVGCNCNLIVNANPDTSGLVPEADFQRYVEFGEEIRRRFGTPISETSGQGDMLELDLGKPTKIHHVSIMEDIAHGERVREYVVEGLVGETWQKLCEGISIGHKRIEKLDAAEVSGIRLRCTKSAAVPRIRKLAVYKKP